MSVFNKIPNPKELEKELNEYLAKKYGSKIKLAMPLMRFVFSLAVLRVVKTLVLSKWKRKK